MGLDPSAPEMTFLLVMLHCGTMGAVMLYFWRRWKILDRHFLKMAILATGVTGFLGLGLKKIIESILATSFRRGWFEAGAGVKVGVGVDPPTIGASPEIEHLFKNLPLMALALFAVGIFMIYADYKTRRRSSI